MYAVVIFSHIKSIRVILVKWVLNFDKKKINQKCAIAIRIWEKNKFWQNPIQKGFAERTRRVV
jgi:hypothetical protein